MSIVFNELLACRENGALEFVTDLCATVSRIDTGLLTSIPVSTIDQEGVITMTKTSKIDPSAPRTFADVIELIQKVDGLSKSRRRDLISALRSMAKFFDLRPEEVPANTYWLRQRLRQFHPKQADISDKYFANIKSAVLAALKLSGANNSQTAWQPPMNEAFKGLYDQIPDPLLGYKLSRLFRWCSHKNLSPDQLTDGIIEQFEEMIVNETFHKNPAKVVRDAVLTWNKMRDRIDGWPDITLYRAPSRIPWTFALELFPDSFQREVDAWCDRLAMTDLFDEDAPVRANRPATIKHRRFQIRMTASAIVRMGTPIDEITSLSDLVSIENFQAGIQFMMDRRDGKITEAMFTLATGIKSIAKHHVKVDESHLERLKRLCSRIDQQADRYRKKNKDRLAQFDDPRNLYRLMALPARLIQKAQKPGPKPRSSALLIQSAVVIETLLFCPMRISNLANLDINHHLRWIGSGRNRRLFITIPGEQVKNDTSLYYELTGASADLMQQYIDEARPSLSDAPSTALFPKLDGTPKNPADLSNQITRHILAEAGLAVNAHLFRSLASKIHNLVCAGDAATISHVLGDRIETILKSYAQFEQKSALETYQSSVNTVRGRGREAA